MSLFGPEIGEHLKEILASNGGWVTTDDIVRELDALDAWGDFVERALVEAKKAVVRKQMRQLLDSRGKRAVASIAERGEDGKVRRIYKQEELFTIEDYRQVCQYMLGRGRYFFGEAREYADRCRARHGEDPLAGEELPEGVAAGEQS